MRIRFTFKIFYELVASICIFIILEILFWWLILWVAKTSGCNVFDPGLFKPAFVSCHDSLKYGDFLEVFIPGYMMVIGIPTFITIFLLAMNFYIVFPAMFVVAFGISVLLTRIFGNTVMSNSKFPILIRVVFSFFKKQG